MMTRLSALAGLSAWSGLVVLLAGACGGKGFSSEDGDGGASPGGTTSHAGKSAGGSSSNAGSSSGGARAGSGSGGSGTAGAAGSNPNDGCSAPPAQGPCQAAFQNWYHDPATGICMPWLYGGCGANANNYESLEACQEACPGRLPNYDACQQASDCLVTGPGCCGMCDGTGITAHDLIAYNRQFALALQCGVAFDAAGPGGDPGAGAPAPQPVPILCECAPPEPGQGTLKVFVPSCVQDQCAIEDLRTSAVTACQTEQDCRLRSGTGCCEGCGAGGIVAVRNDGSFEKLACGDVPQPCPACEPVPPPNAVAVCLAGHCEVAYVGPTN